MRKKKPGQNRGSSGVDPSPTRRGNRLKCFYNHLLFENQNPRHSCWGFCGVGRPRRVGGTDLNVLQSLPFFKIKTPDITVGGFVVWAGFPACRQAGNQLMCFHNQHSSKNKKPQHCCQGFCGVGRDRTGDTRIFSPLLYRLSYRTILLHAM